MLIGPPVFGKALPVAVKNMSDKEYEDYLHRIYLKQYKEPVSYEVWSNLVSALSEPSHQLQYKDNLWDLSESYFKDHWLWSKLWVANEHIANPHRIMKGDTIRFDLKTLTAVNTKGHSVDLQKQFPEIKIPPSVYQKPALSEREIPSSLPHIKDRPDPSPPDLGFDLEIVPVNKNALLPFYLSEEDLSGQGVVESKDGYGSAALPGEDIIISYDGDIIEGGIYTVFENRGPPVFSFTSLFGINVKGYEIAVKGSVRVLGYLEGSELYRARVVEALGAILPGDQVMSGNIPRYILSQKGTAGTASGKIIGSPHRGKRFFGLYSFVYLDKGLANGVQVGDIYHVKLNEDTRIQYPYKYEKPAIGKLRVIHANPDTSTAIIIGSRDTIKVGDFFEPQSGVSVLTEGLPGHEVIDGEFDDGEGEFQDMQMQEGEGEMSGGEVEAEDAVQDMEEVEESANEGGEPVDTVPEETMEEEAVESEGEGGEVMDAVPEENMKEEELKIEEGAADEAGGAVDTAPEKKIEEFSDEELEKPVVNQNVEEGEKKTPTDDNFPSPVPKEIKEEFDEIKDM